MANNTDYVIKKWWTAYVVPIIKFLLHISFLAFLYIALGRYFTGVSSWVINGFLVCYSLYALAVLKNDWLDQSCDSFIILYDKVIHTDRNKHFTDKEAEIEFGKIQETIGKRTGVGYFVNFGIVQIKTAGASSVYFVDHVRKPKEKAEKIKEEKKRFLASRGLSVA
jgi:hypothetical protein